jgi:hypothetical protein
MNRWLLLRRARGPAFLILFGITVLLSQWDVLSLRRSWPLYLILAGVLLLAERAALAAPPPSSLTGSPQPPGSRADAPHPSFPQISAESTEPTQDRSPEGRWRTQ